MINIRFSLTGKSFVSRLLVLSTCLLLVHCDSVSAGMKAMVQNQPFRASIEITDPVAGKPSAVLIRTFADGKQDALDQQQRILHVVLASADYQDVAHVLGPEALESGLHRIEHTFTRAGRYRIWVEVDNAQNALHHDSHADLIAFQDVTIGGTSVATTSLVRGQTATVGSLTVTVVPQQLSAKTPLRLGITVKDSLGITLPLAQPEGALFALIGQETNFFRHGHLNTHPDGLTADIENIFPEAGEYLLWIHAFVFRGGAFEFLEVPFLLTVI